jgi:hypothetical protein
MITFPRNNETWQVTQGSEKKPDIIYAHNVNFDDEGRVALSSRTIEIASSDDDADFQLSLAMTNNAGADGTVFTTDKVFDISFDDTVTMFDVSELNPSFGEIPDGDQYGTIVQFNNLTHIIENDRILKYDGGATPWSTTGITLTGTVHHPACEFKNRRTLVVGDGNTVKQYNTSYATTDLAQLTLPAGFEVIGIDYNAGLVGIATVNENDEAYFFVWDGGSNEANYGFPVGARRCYWVKAYKNTFVTLTGKGQILYWTSSGMEQLCALPIYYRYKASYEDYRNYTATRERSVVVDGDIILFNIGTRLEIRTPEEYSYDTTTPSGIWCYDPNVGLYHRSALTSTPLIQDSSLSLSNSEFTLNVNAPDTGTEIRIADANENLTGVDVNKLYYVIKTDTQKIKLAETYEDAIAGNAVTLGGSIDSFTMVTMIPKNDFGQLEYENGGVVFLFSANDAYPEFFLAGKSGDDITGDTGYDNLVAPTALCENRGQFILEKMFSDTLNDTFETAYIKTSGLDTSSKIKSW